MKEIYKNDFYRALYNDEACKDDNLLLGVITDNLKLFKGYFLGDKIEVQVHFHFRDEVVKTIEEYMLYMSACCRDKIFVDFGDKRMRLFSGSRVSRTGRFFKVVFLLDIKTKKEMRERQKELMNGVGT